VEQETGQMGQFWGNPVISVDDKLKGLERIVRSSDKKLKAFFSADQVRKYGEYEQNNKGGLKQVKTKQEQRLAP